MKEIYDKPIRLPENLYWSIFRRFGTDELISMFFNVLSTGIASIYTSNPLILSFTGPVIEKIGFFPAHLKEAWDIFRTTPFEQRKSLWFYVKQEFKVGLVSLAEDILVHDPLYATLMWLGLKTYTTTPAWLLSFVSFVIAVAIVPLVEVGILQIAFWRHKSKLKKMGFEEDHYYETRFLVDENYDTEKLLNKMAIRFLLKNRKDVVYHDTYFENDLPQYLNFKPCVRARLRYSEDGKKIHTAQVVWTRASEMCGKRAYDQSRYFPISKSKFYRWITIHDEIQPYSVTVPYSGKKIGEITFERTVIRNSELYVSADKPLGTPYYCIEIKARKKDIGYLIRAMRYAMREFPIVQTTNSKIDLKRSKHE